MGNTRHLGLGTCACALLSLVAACGPDGAGLPDAGISRGDAGTVPDASVPLADAGADPDAGASDAGPTADAGPSATDAGPQLVDVIDHPFLIEHFGGVAVDALGYADDIAGFQQYLDDVGVTYFSANEIVTPNNPTAASDCGYSILLPGQELWENIGALALFSDQLRAWVGEPVAMRNWWRPDCYNTAVGGAAGGDHPAGDAVDLDFQSATSRAAAQQFLCDGYWAQDIVAAGDIAPSSTLDPRLNMSIGLGGATIHLGVLSNNGRRFWKYGSYTVEPGSGSCW